MENSVSADMDGVEIKLSKIEDPIGFMLKVLKRQATVLEYLQTTPREPVAIIYNENVALIDECHRDVNVSWNRLRETVIEAGNAKGDKDRMTEKLVGSLSHGVTVCQKVLDMFDDLCDRYGIPANDPHLFSRIGSILHP